MTTAMMINKYIQYITYHNRSKHRSLYHPPDGSIVIYVPTSKTWNNGHRPLLINIYLWYNHFLYCLIQMMSHILPTVVKMHTKHCPDCHTHRWGSWVKDFTEWVTHIFYYLISAIVLWLFRLTPADDGVPIEVSPLREEGLHQQSKQVQSLNEQPEVVW